MNDALQHSAMQPSSAALPTSQAMTMLAIAALDASSVTLFASLSTVHCPVHCLPLTVVARQALTQYHSKITTSWEQLIVAAQPRQALSEIVKTDRMFDITVLGLNAFIRHR